MGAHGKTDKNPLIVPSSVSLSGGSNDRGLRYRKRGIWIASIYLPLLIVPWVLTCIMMYRPIMLPSYINQLGEYSMGDFGRHERFVVAADVLNRMASVLGVPVVSAMLAQGAVVYSQRRKVGQELTVKQLLALAGRGWIDIPVLWESWSSTVPAQSKYLWFGAVLVLITAVQPPLQSLLISDETMLVVTGDDYPLSSLTVGKDPQPQYMEHCPQNLVVQRTLGNIINVSPSDVQTHLWMDQVGRHWYDVDDSGNSFESVYGYHSPLLLGQDGGNVTFFVSPVINGSTTGVLRQHAVRIDSQATCVLDSNFPDECSGDRPFSTDFRTEFVEASICAEGSVNKFPWARSRDKQDITERLWLDLKTLPGIDEAYYSANFTMRCEATSIRGWFELGNYRNGFAYQPTLDRWPSAEEIETEFNEYILANETNNQYPVKEEPPVKNVPFEWADTPDPFRTGDYVAAGPLMSTALALFGNITFFHSAREALGNQSLDTDMANCFGNRFPFWSYTPENSRPQNLYACAWSGTQDARRLSSRLVAGFMALFREPEKSKELIEVAMYFANEAVLLSSSGFGSRSISSAPGLQILKPQKKMSGIIVVSILILLQVLGLVLLLLFIYSTPAWTGNLGADALVQIGAQLRDQGGDITATSSGLVGVVESDTAEASPLMTETRSEGLETPPAKKKEVVLALGAPGLITKRCLKEQT